MTSSNYSVTKHADRTARKVVDLTDLENFDPTIIKQVNRYLKTQIRRAYNEGLEAQNASTSQTPLVCQDL